MTYERVFWPEYQDLMECPGFEEHSYPVESGFLVESNWLKTYQQLEMDVANILLNKKQLHTENCDMLMVICKRMGITVTKNGTLFKLNRLRK